MKNRFLQLAMLVMASSLFVRVNAQDTQAPPQPGQPVVESTTNNSITITWDNVATDGGMMGYLVYVDGVLEPDTLKIGQLVGYIDDYPKYREIGNEEDFSSLHFTAYELAPSTPYSLTVASIDSALNVSGQSPAIEATTEAVGEEGKIILYPTDDAVIIGGSGNYLTFNTGDWPLLLVRPKEGFDGWQELYRPFIKFDISSLTDVKEAKLHLFGSLFDDTSWLDEQQIITASLAFYKVGSDWEEETITFSTVPDEDIGADLEGDPQKDAMLVRDTLQKYSAVSFLSVSNDPAKLGIAGVNEGDVIPYSWFQANFNTYVTTEVAAGAEVLSFTIADTTFNKFNVFRFHSKDSYTNRIYLEITPSAVLSAKDAFSSQVAVYPNPMNRNQSINIALAHTGNYFIEITDIAGRTFFSNNYRNAKNISLNIQNTQIEQGMYMVIITNESGVSSTKKILIE